MQRLTDIVAKDLNYIVNEYRDIFRETVLQCGAEKVTVMASLQSDDVVFTSDVSPKNAFSLDLYFIESTNDKFNKGLLQNAIIYVDTVPFRIVDADLTMGLRTLSLERKGGR